MVLSVTENALQLEQKMLGYGDSDFLGCGDTQTHFASATQ